MRETMTALPWSSLDAVERAYRELEAENARLRAAMQTVVNACRSRNRRRSLSLSESTALLIVFILREALSPGEKP